MSLLEQDITKKKQRDQPLEPKKFKAGDNKKYEVKTIIDSIVYG